MTDTSRVITSNQLGLHPKLAELVTRHLNTEFLRPPAPHSVQSFTALRERLQQRPQPLILDSFCGTGQSTAMLAQRHPNHLVVGVDQSAHRLQKHCPNEQDNYLLLQANCEDIWLLLLAQGLQLDFHYLLYPNPWPKSKHLQRRVHGHASFSRLLDLGGQVELRSNWQLYVEEFGVAMHLAGKKGVVKRLEVENPLTLFEEKYQRSGHALWAFAY